MVSLIVLNYNDYDTTTKFIKLALPINNINHIIVVDNHSSDASLEELDKLCCDKVELIVTPENKGYANGNNYGAFYAIKKYKSRYLIIANPDIIISEKTIKYLLDFAKNVKNLGCVTCVMKCASDIKLPIASRLPKYRDCLLENLIVLKKIMGNSLEYASTSFESKIVDVDVLPGSFFMIESDVFQKIGGFDEQTFLYYEENILAYKLKQIERKNYLLTEESYIHNHSITINKNISSVKRRLEIAFESRYYYCKKYLRCNRLELFLLKLTFNIGLRDYLFALKITGKDARKS